MRILFTEIRNFRKIEACRIDLDKEKTLFVGANNSGKTSAMDALILFLSAKDRGKLKSTDITLSNWKEILSFSQEWENPNNIPDFVEERKKWLGVLPSVDLWLEVEKDELHHVRDIIPHLKWSGGKLGVRFQLEPRNCKELYKEYVQAFNQAKDTKQKADSKLSLWPTSIHHFLERKIKSYFEVNFYLLDPAKCVDPEKGVAKPQALDDDSDPLDGDPMKGLIKVNIINAQRGFRDPNSQDEGEDDSVRGTAGNLSTQLKGYYTKHINPAESPDVNDVKALEAIESAQDSFNERINEGFKEAVEELETLGYPGFGDPKITISSKLKPMEGLNHPAAVQFDVGAPGDLKLPEQYNGLGYQNLISMIFKLMRYRDEWLRVGKVSKLREETEEIKIEPLHLVLIEEPEAHLHAQVQQVFINKAYSVLRNNKKLVDSKALSTQLVVSTHSSHIAHEVDFSGLRYFQRKDGAGDIIPVACIKNLSTIFGVGADTDKFVTRYIKSTHCDLFFADAVILVEGPAERMLVPHFIKKDFPKLTECYLSILEVGGSHAHRLKPLIESLGIFSLIVTDIDSKNAEGKNAPPTLDANFTTSNSTLKTWVPQKEKIDDLINLNEDNKVVDSVRVAFQIEVKINNKKGEHKVIPYTFEDSLIFENFNLLKDLNGNGFTKKAREAATKIESGEDIDTIRQSVFEDLKSAKKAEFALDLLYQKNPELINTPKYIKDGLNWLLESLKSSKKKVENKESISETSASKKKVVKKKTSRKKKA